MITLIHMDGFPLHQEIPQRALAILHLDVEIIKIILIHKDFILVAVFF
jgi:hypothetical protein